MKKKRTRGYDQKKEKSGNRVGRIENVSTGKALIWLICAALAVLILIVFAQTFHFAYVNIDDTLYITENDHTQQGLNLENIQWAFTTGHASNWHPITWLSHMMDVSLFGVDPGPHHMVNVLFHMLCTWLLFLLLRSMTGRLWPSAFVAALFAVHPAHVESVAWISERKDVLSTFFWFLTLLAYLKWVRKPGVSRYILILLSFTLGLMAKPMLITLPAVLLLLDFWPLDRVRTAESSGKNHPKKWTGLFLEKAPLFFLSLLSAAATFAAQRAGEAVATLTALPFSFRLGNAFVSYVRYLWIMVCPIHLTVYYPHPGENLEGWKVFLSVLFLAVLTFLVMFKRKRFLFLPTGWLWYLGTLIPVIGIVQVGSQSHADRYTYVPLTGIFILVAWGGAALVRKFRIPGTVVGFTVVIVVSALTVLAHRQTGYWRNSKILFAHAIHVSPENYLVHKNYGAAMADEKRYEEAARHYRRAMQYEPNDENLYYNLGNALVELGRKKEAINMYRRAVRVDPEFAVAYFNLGNELARQKKYDEAVQAYREATRIRPNHVGYLVNLGNTFAMMNRSEEAVDIYLKVIRFDPDNIDAHINLGNALAVTGKTERAIEHYRRALQLSPNHVDAHFNLGYVLMEKGERDTAEREFRTVLRLKPDHEMAGAYLDALKRNGTDQSREQPPASF